MCHLRQHNQAPWWSAVVTHQLQFVSVFFLGETLADDDVSLNGTEVVSEVALGC